MGHQLRNKLSNISLRINLIPQFIIIGWIYIKPYSHTSNYLEISPGSPNVHILK